MVVWFDHGIIQGVVASIKVSLLSLKTLEKVKQGNTSVFISSSTLSTRVHKGISSHMAMERAIHLPCMFETTI